MLPGSTSEQKKSMWLFPLIVTKSLREKVAKALEGDYRPEHVFTLKRALRVGFTAQIEAADSNPLKSNGCRYSDTLFRSR